MQKITVSLNERNLAELLHPDRGVTTVSIPEISSLIVNDLCQQASQLVYEPAKHVKTKVEQNFNGCGEFENGSIWMHMAEQFAEGLQQSFERLQKLELLSVTPLTFTDCALQHYPQTVGTQKYGIGPHRDQKDFVNLIVVLLLHGDSNFFICRDREGGSSEKIEAKPGQLIVMRGGGFAQDTLSRPLHYVGPIDERGRLSFGLRQVSSDPAAAARIRSLFNS